MDFERTSNVTIMGDQDQSPGSCGNHENSKAQILENPPHKTKKIQTECAETRIDWISQLPDSLIVQMLSLLPTTDAFRTTILSKRWQHLWTGIDNVDFSCLNTNWSDSWEVSKFISFMDNVLCHLSCSKVKKFSLHFGFRDSVSYSTKIDKWLEIAVNKKVEDLDLRVRYNQEQYSLPQVLCNSSSILKLKCTNCAISEDSVLNWTSLKSLTLQDLLLRDEQIEKITSSCPQLESLKLYDFCGFHRLHITSPKCRILELIDHNHPEGHKESMFRDDCYFEIVAPYVQHLRILGDFAGTEIWLGNLSSLVHADLTFNFYDSRRLDKVIDITIVKHHLVSLRSANELMVPSWHIEAISMLMLENEDLLLPLLECKSLTIRCWISKCSFLGISTLLSLTPNLENLKILPEEFCQFQDYWDEHINLLGDNYNSLQESIFKGSLQNLKNVEIISSFCSCLYEADTTELPEFLKSLLEHAVNLEKLVIAPESRRCNICSTNISKMLEYLLAFPRASKSVVVSLGSVSRGELSLKSVSWLW